MVVRLGAGRGAAKLPRRTPLAAAALVLCLLAAGCGAAGKGDTAPAGSRPGEAGSSAAQTGPAPLGPYPARARLSLRPITIPKRPAATPGYAELDPEAGLHMTGEAVDIDLGSWRLEVSGEVRRPLKLDYDTVRSLPGIRAKETLVCPGYFEDTAVWAGVSLEALLALAEPRPGATGLELRGADGYSSWVGLADTRGAFLAYELGGAPLPVLHGFPLRAVFPSQKGAKWVKWLLSIEVQ